MGYKLKINGGEYDKVAGSKDWTKTISRDFNDRIFRTKGDFDFTGWGSLFNLIYNNTVSNGVCSGLEARVYFREDKVSDYAEWFRGQMLPQDNAYDLINRSVDGKILEDTWAARFANSNEQKVFLRSTASKNGLTIPSCTVSVCDFYDPSDGTYNAAEANRDTFKMFDVFTFLVAYHTDGAATFASDFFNGGDGDQYYITTGEEIRTGNNAANPEVSFNEVFENCNKKMNLWIVIEGTFDAPVLRIEPFEYVFDDVKVLDVEDPESIEMKIDLDQLYTIVEVGSDAVDYNGSTANYPNVRFQSWNNESYNTAGDCEFENNTLDLVSNWKIDTNTIEQVLMNDNEDFDDDIFIVEIDSVSLNAFQFTTDYTGTATVEYIYNFNLTNEQVITAWFNGIPQQIQKQEGGSAYVYADSPPFTGVVVTDIIFAPDNDNIAPGSDVDGLYYTPTEWFSRGGQFVAPLSGFYRAKASADVVVSSITYVNLYIDVFDEYPAMNLLSRRLVDRAFPSDTKIGDEFFIYLNAGNVARYQFEIIGTSFLLQNGYLEYSSAFPDISDSTPKNPLLYIYDIQRFKLPLADFQTLEQNLGYVRFTDTKSNRYWDVWAKELKYNAETQLVEAGEFIGRPPITQRCWILEDCTWNDDCYWDDSQLWVECEIDKFIITVKTDNAGVSANDEFQIPTTGAGFNYVVDWGDGNSDAGVTGTTTHTYASSGTYTVKISGLFPRIYFNNGADKAKLLTIEQWGAIAWDQFTNAFYGCSNLTLNATDSPNLSGLTSMSTMFARCTSLVGISAMNNWDTSAVTDMSALFRRCTVFNTDISAWDVTAVTDMSEMFSDAAAFDQDIGDWYILALTDATNFLQSVTMSTANYNALLTGWTGWSGGAATKTVQSAVTFEGGNSTYSTGSDADDARAWLIATKSWTITDGGGV